MDLFVLLIVVLLFCGVGGFYYGYVGGIVGLLVLLLALRFLGFI